MCTHNDKQTNDTARYKAEALPRFRLKVDFYRVREIVVNGQGTGKFHYTRRRYPSEKIEPVGYCAKGCPGHDSYLGAYEHLRQYLLDRRFLLDDASHWSGEVFGICAVCGQPATRHACIVYGSTDDFEGFDSPSGWSWNLCPEHYTREAIDRLFHFSEFEVVNWAHHINMAAFNEGMEGLEERPE